MTSPTLLERAAAGERLPWHEHFLMLAEATATRSTCSKRRIGAVIVRNHIPVAMGYNGGPSGYAHCIDGACPRGLSGAPTGYGYDSVDGAERCIAIHAEANAINFASPDQRRGATLYCTLAPCFGCAKLITNSGITHVVAGASYADFGPVRAFLEQCGVDVTVPPA